MWSSFGSLVWLKIRAFTLKNMTKGIMKELVLTWIVGSRFDIVFITLNLKTRTDAEKRVGEVEGKWDRTKFEETS